MSFAMFSAETAQCIEQVYKETLLVYLFHLLKVAFYMTQDLLIIQFFILAKRELCVELTLFVGIWVFFLSFLSLNIL